jgi:hypothetical protein
MESDEIRLSFQDSTKWAHCAEREVIQRFNLKPPKGYPNYPSYCFVKKNSNRYFRKHLGFTLDLNLRKKNDDGDRVYRGYTSVHVNDYKKLMVFMLKYGL